jgi:hypothetical protein
VVTPGSGFAPLTIVSGAQTGVDRAALDVAMGRGMPVGGWCPSGRAAEDGPIDPRYPLRETPSADPTQRTAWNVRDSDGTLLLVTGAPSAGTDLTRDLAHRMGRPVLEASLDAPADPDAFRRWLAIHKIRTLNIAGPCESGSPGVYAAACAWLRAALS